VWERFNMKDPQQHLIYYRSLLAVYERRSDSWMVGELQRVLVQLEDLIRPPSAAAVQPSGCRTWGDCPALQPLKGG
jgi:hypothetical protein